MKTPSWISRACSRLLPSKFSPVVVRSVNWPGAHAVAYNDKFANIYVGDGLKDISNKSRTFVPPKLGAIQAEYNESLVEQDDPTVEQENELEQKESPKEEDGGEGEQEAGEEED
jgi:radial spoke head protein 4A